MKSLRFQSMVFMTTLFGFLCSLTLSANAQVGANLPEVGEQLPEVNVFDDKGEQFSTKSLRGKHTVLVFGCLT